MSNYPALSPEEHDAILAGLRLLQRDLDRGCVDDDILPILTDEGRHAGLGSEGIDTLIEERVNVGSLLHCSHARRAPDVDNALLCPDVPAEVYPDDRAFTVEFFANRWFAQASDSAILDLASEDWSNSEASDRVAQDTSEWSPDVEQVFHYQGTLDTFGKRSMGFECRVDPESAMAWLKRHRPGVWAQIICERHGVRLVEAQEPEIRGRWDWIDEGRAVASDASLETACEAALDAVRSLALDHEPNRI